MLFSQKDKGLTQVKTGLDVLLEKHLNLLNGKKIGIITNQTGISSRGKHIIDELHSVKGVIVLSLFAPEHGIRGEISNGKQVESYFDYSTGIQIWSLYGKNRKPTSQMLKNLDLLLFDIQDIGARFYTYISTLGYAMEAAAENNIEFIVLDRPNPITGVKVEGPVLDLKFKSFVGMYPIPVMHGMTVGELALMIKGEKFMKNMDKLNLMVIKIEGWKRDMWYDSTGLKWVRTSPNIKNLNAAIIYPGLCLLEGTNLSEGRGTDSPFEIFGAPWIDSNTLVDKLNSLNINGVKFTPVKFVPKDIPGVAINPKYENLLCYGAKINITDRNKFLPLKTALLILDTINKTFPEKLILFPSINRLCGNADLKLHYNKDMTINEIYEKWEKESKEFMKIRKKYLIYK